MCSVCPFECLSPRSLTLQKDSKQIFKKCLKNQWFSFLQVTLHFQALHMNQVVYVF